MCRLAARVVFALLAAVAKSDTLSEEADLIRDALADDEQCVPGDTTCSLNALQLRAARQNATVSDAGARENASAGADWSYCTTYGCYGYSKHRPCQCNPKCHRYGNCCPGYDQVCRPKHTPSHGGSPGQCYKTGKTYKLNWQAKGRDFFRNWSFVVDDMVHGAQQFVTREEALQKGIISHRGSDAVLKVGGLRYPSRPGEAYKRFAPHIRSNMAWDPKESFIVAMKYKHVPNGCGIWPGLWTVGSQSVWPAGGELDIMEYPNMDPSKVSFHTGEHCRLKPRTIDHCLPHGSRGSGPMDCYTSYFKNAFGCRPKQRQLTGSQWSGKPGVIAAQWTQDTIVVYHFPEGQIPADLSSDNPKPDTWSSQYVVAYLPFERPCTSIEPQEIVLNIQLCGDAAGNSWSKGRCGYQTAAKQRMGMCVTGLSQPSDCCTQWVTSALQDSYMRSHAYFKVSWIKVFTPTGRGGTPSPTFLRNGELLTGP